MSSPKVPMTNQAQFHKIRSGEPMSLLGSLRRAVGEDVRAGVWVALKQSPGRSTPGRDAHSPPPLLWRCSSHRLGLYTSSPSLMSPLQLRLVGRGGCKGPMIFYTPSPMMGGERSTSSAVMAFFKWVVDFGLEEKSSFVQVYRTGIDKL